MGCQTKLIFRILFCLSVLPLWGCSSARFGLESPGGDLTRDAIVVGSASVVLGSLALGKADGSFRSTPEGWFEKDSRYAGMDKLGHVWYGNTIADFFFERNQNRFAQPVKTAAMSSVISFGIMAAVEIADGFADTQVGFSYEDVIANAVGAGFSYFRNSRPWIRNLVDFRLEYLPRRSIPDWAIDTFYSDQRYLLAWKLSALSALKSTPLRFAEFHTGYYARGYSSKESPDEKRRIGYVGVGVNLSELFGTTVERVSHSRRTLNFIFERIQLPYTSVRAGPI